MSFSIERSETIKEVFGLVKDAVDATLGESRNGLDIGFIEMGNTSQCVFTTLLHEYMHSLGYLDETTARKLTCIFILNPLDSFYLYGQGFPPFQRKRPVKD